MIAVVGGGLAGLAAAWRLARRGHDVQLFEAGARVGGMVGTVARDGFVTELGPGSIRGDRMIMRSLTAELGLELVAAEPAAKRRFVWAKGRVHELPAGPIAFLKSDILSPRAKLRLFTEPWRKPRREAGDETLADFVERRLGREPVDVLLDPFVTGIYGGDPRALGVDAFAGLGELEARYGSLFGALRARGLGGSGGVFSVGGGLGRLPAALAQALEGRVHLGARVTALDASGARLCVDDVWHDAEAVIVATGCRDAARLLPAAPELARIALASLVKVELGIDKRDLPGGLEGFGLLCSSSSPLPAGAGPVMGIIYASAVFAGRAPPDCHALSVMLGGVHDPGAVERDDDALVAQAIGALGALLGYRGEPRLRHLTRWRSAIPQYAPGHARAIAQVVAGLPGHIALAGNYLQGVGLDAVVASGLAAADSISART